MKLALFGVVLAIAITTAMDATGFTLYSALPLAPLAGLFWFVERLSRAEIGLTAGRPSAYALALAYPLVVLGLIAGVAAVNGAVDVSGADWGKVSLNIALGSTVGILMGLLTEEGFFRGWLWASLARAGQSDVRVLAITSLAFTAWHVSVVSFDTGFDVPAGEIPIYLLNVTLFGAVMGILRLLSRSVIVPSVCHAVWNGIDYPLFGFGENVGALGIEQTQLYGPEVGLLGLMLNAVFAGLLGFVVIAALAKRRVSDTKSLDARNGSGSR